jgi:hypothetical protein
MKRMLQLLVLLVSIPGCTAKAPVSERVGGAVGGGEVIDLMQLSDFAWDNLFVFSPYTPRASVCSRLSEAWSACELSLPPYVGEGSYLLVFVGGNSVVHHEMHSRGNGDFCTSSCALVVAASEARFRAVPHGTLANGETHYALYPDAP